MPICKIQNGFIWMPGQKSFMGIIICPGFYMDKCGMYISKLNSTAQNCAGIIYTLCSHSPWGLFSLITFSFDRIYDHMF